MDRPTDDHAAPKPPGIIGTRHKQVFLMFLGLILAYAMRVNLSVGIVAMTSDVNPNFPTVNWTMTEKGIVSSMFFYGYFCTGIPAGMLAARYGPVLVLGWVGGIFCGLLTVAFPHVSVNLGFYWACAFRVLQGLGQKMKIPWLSIATSIPMWALFLVQLAQNWGFWTLLTLMPTYIDKVLGFNIKENGLLSALPYIVMFFNAILFAFIADYMTTHNIRTVNFRRKMWNSIALYGGSAALLALATIETKTLGAIVLLTIANGLNAGCYCGYLCNHLDLAPNFAGILMGITNGLSNITSILAPTIAGIIVQDDKSIEEWQTVFLTASAVFFVGNTIFLMFGSTKVQPWNNPDVSSIVEEQVSKR
ncbi:unnamed protein product [Nesidiocoris tenuis]|uniref:Major facilitator superfamily (MFS) profile domain-containing protein n=1 Tax=Nesidiocoris tenuis TaxID=355587 RepID=A0A6H5HP98_9HEMI|nr:unnamed protein product [Nesidiocoris tenuis]